MTSLTNQPVQTASSRAQPDHIDEPPRTLFTLVLWLLACVFVPLWLAGCGGSDPAPPPPSEGSATVGAAGGIVTGPDGVRLFLPPEAVETDATFRIARDSSGAPPLPAGIDLASEVYAITPHGTAFGVSASVELPVSPALAAGRPTFLMKADPGGRWAVVGTGLAGARTLRAGIDSLSYLAVGACQDNLPVGSPFGQACPSSNQLSLELLINGSTPVPISQDTTYGAPIPVLLVTTPETLTFRMTWTRPAGTNRVDVLNTGTGFTGAGLVRQAGFTFSTTAPRFLDVNENSFSRIFTVDVDPAGVSGASGPNGVVRRIWAQTSYNVTGPGNIGSANWDFFAWVPIQVRSIAGATLPVIAAQPASVGVTEGQPAGFSVTASITPAAALTYQWSRRASASAAFAPIPGASAASYSLATTALTDHGAEFQVQVCAGPTRCVLSDVATLSVTQTPVAPAFTTSPLDQGVVAGQTASLNAVATGTPLPAIRWQRAPAGSSNFADITGVPACVPTNPGPGAPNVAASCTVGPLDVGDSGQRYRAVATSTAAPGGVTSSFATVTVNAAAVAPAITQQPAPQSTTVGGSATFRVTATGTAVLSYAWRLGSGNMPSVSGQFAFTAPSGDCRGTVTYSNGGATATFSDLTAACNGLLAVVTVSNNVNPPAVSSGALLTVTPVTQALSLLAGVIGGQGSLDGPVAEARVALSPDNGIATDAAGNVYFSESVSGKVRRISAAGVVGTLAGAGTPLRNPAGVALDSGGNLFVVERSANRILRITPAGALSTWATVFNLDGPLAIDASDNLYATVNVNGVAVINRISPQQVVSGFYAFSTVGDGIGAMVVTSDGSLYGPGLGGLGGTVLRISPAGDLSTVAGTAGEFGDVDGMGAAARFTGINGITLGSGGHLYATDGNNRSVRRITLAGAVSTVSGGASSPVFDFPGAIAAAANGELLVGNVARITRLSPAFSASTVVGSVLPAGVVAGPVALDGAGNAYVAMGNSIRRITPAGVVSTFATISNSSGLNAIAFDASGFLVAVDVFNVWRISSAGVVTVLAGGASGYVDATGAAAGFEQIGGLAVDAGGNVFVAERIANTIRRITPAGAVSTYAGAINQAGTADGALTSARFNVPRGLAFDASGNLWVADAGNLTVRRITPAGAVSTVAGSPGVAGTSDGAGASARFQALGPLAATPNGSMLVADGSTLRRVTSAGAVATVLGVAGENGVRLGVSPRVNNVFGLAVRPNGRAVLSSEGAVLEASVP